MLTCQNGHMKVAEWLESKGADVNASDEVWQRWYSIQAECIGCSVGMGIVFVLQNEKQE